MSDSKSPSAPPKSEESPPSSRAGRSLLDVANLGVSWTNQLVAIVGSFVVTPATLNGLGDKYYGIWLLVNSFIVHLRTLDLGMSAGTMKFSAGAIGRGDRESLRKVYSTSIALFAMASILAAGITFVLTSVLPKAYPGALSGQQTIILILGLSGTIDLFFRPQAASLRSKSLFFVPELAEIVTYSIFKMGLVLYFSSRLTLPILAWLTLGETVVRNVGVTILGLILCDWTRAPTPSAIQKDMLKGLALYGAGTFLINVGEIIRFQIDAAVIGYYLPDQTLISVYGIGMRLVSIAYQAIGVVGAMAIPRFSGLYESGDIEGCRALLRRANLATGLITAYILSNIAVLGLPFLRMWIRKPWVEDAFDVTLIMLPAYLVGLLTGPGAGLLAGAGKLRGMTVLTLTEAACNFVLSVLLLKSMGIYGVCLGTAIPMVVFRGIVFPLVLRQSVEVNVWDYYRSHGRGLVVGAVYCALILPFRYLSISGPVSFVLAGLGTTLVFAIVVLVALPEARSLVRKRLLRRA